MKLNQLIHLCQVNSVNRLLKKKKEVNSVNHICTHRKVIKKKKKKKHKEEETGMRKFKSL